MNGMLDGLGVLLFVLICFLPLGVWKAIELIALLISHIHWN